MNANLFKSLLLVVIGVIAQFGLFLLRKGKSKKLEEMKMKEEEEKQRIMEEAWTKAGEEVEPELLIIRELDRDEFEEVKVYDGDINQMTFAHVKNSKAFDTRDLFDIDEETTIDDS